MPYDAPDYSEVLWENGRPYWKTASGKKTFIPPLVAAQMRDNPRAQQWAASQGTSITYGGTDDNPTVENVTNNSAPGGGLLHERGQWNSDTGEWDQPINWGNIASLAVGGAIAAPFVVPALAGAGASSAGGAGAASAATPAAAYGPLAGGYAGATTAAAVPSSLASLGGATAAGAGAATVPTAITSAGPSSGPLASGITGATTSATVPSALAANAGTGGAMASGGLVSRQGIGGFSWGDIVGGALSYVQARQSANASQEAAQAQADAVKAGIAEQARQYDLSRGDFLGNQAYTRQQITGLAPYQQLGSTALGNLYSLTGHAAPAGLGAPGVAGMPPPAPGTTSATRSTPSPLGGYADTAGLNGGGMLRIQAPTGEIQMVPAGQAQHFIQRGAKVVS